MSMQTGIHHEVVCGIHIFQLKLPLQLPLQARAHSASKSSPPSAGEESDTAGNQGLDRKERLEPFSTVT